MSDQPQTKDAGKPRDPAPPEGPARAVSPWSLLLGIAVLATIVMGQWVWLVAVLGLALLIMVHELGHFLAAKAFGMRVEKFYLGFPPAALRHTYGETEYGIGIIPLGGFCKISGMTPEEEVPDGTGDRVYHKKAVWKRNITIAAGPLMNVLAAFVILVLFFGIQGVTTATLTLDEVGPGTPAAKAGLKVGDTLIGADGRRWTTWDEAAAYFRAHMDDTIRLTYEREGADGVVTRQSVKVKLVEHPEDPGKGYLGVSARAVRERPGVVRAVTLGATGFREVVVGTFKGFWMLFTGQIDVTGENGAVGPVGIIDVSREAVQQSWYPILLAYLSFNLGLINLLPMLPFDGGHLVINTVEGIRGGRRLNQQLLERLVTVGTVLLVTLFLLLTFNDVKRLFGG